MLSDRLRRFARINCETPYAVFDIEAAEQAYDRHLAAMAPFARVQFAVKARPEPLLLELLSRRGAWLDVSSTAEVRLALAVGCPADRLSHSNVFRSEAEIAAAFDLGVRMFTFDSAAQLARLRRCAPGSSVLLRLAVPTGDARLPMSARFGCAPTEAVELAVSAAGVGMDVAGLTWHSGSQQTDPTCWRTAIAEAARVWQDIAARGVHSLRVLNVGGGMPASYRDAAVREPEWATVITTAVRDCFGTESPDVVIEPGRGLVAEAGITVTTVKAVVERADQVFVALDVGIWSAGLTEGAFGALEYPVEVIDHPAGRPCRPVVLCGPTCDPQDELRAANPYLLPASLAPGDRLIIGSTGAYSATTMADGFCGYPRLPQHILTADPALALEVCS